MIFLNKNLFVNTFFNNLVFFKNFFLINKTPKLDFVVENYLKYFLLKIFFNKFNLFMFYFNKIKIINFNFIFRKNKKLFFFKINNYKINNYINVLKIRNKTKKKPLAVKKIITLIKIFYTDINCNFNNKKIYKTKNFFFKKLRLILFYVNLKFITMFLLKSFINNFKYKFFKKKFNFDIYIYKNIYKNFRFIKNVNKIFFNKNYFLLNNNLLDNYEINSFFINNYNIIYNNHFPFIIVKKYKEYLFNKFNIKNISNFVSIFNLYFINFFEFYFKNNFFMKISNNIQKKKNEKLNFFLKHFNKNIKFQKFFDFNEMLEILIICFLYKDLIFFKNWLIKMLNIINVKNHKKFFVILNDFIIDNFILISYNFHIKGFYFCVKGKIGLSGNAKKKKYFFKKGFLNLSSKNSKIDNQRFNVKTNCGSLGFNIILSF